MVVVVVARRDMLGWLRGFLLGSSWGGKQSAAATGKEVDVALFRGMQAEETASDVWGACGTSGVAVFWCLRGFRGILLLACCCEWILVFTVFRCGLR